MAEESSNTKLIVSTVGLVVVLGAAIAGYIFVAKPRLKQWNEDRKNINERKETLETLRKDFGQQKDPKIELQLLKKETLSLIKANEALDKIKTPGKEKGDFPEELRDPDPEIERELFRNYMKLTMEASEKTLTNVFKDAGISPPEVSLYTDLSHADEAAYYTNRAAGLMGIASALAKTGKQEGNSVVVENIILDDYEKGRAGNTGVLNELSYGLNMTMNTEALISFLYNLKEEDGYYFLKDISIKPSLKRISRTSDKGESQNLSVSARVNTTMIFESKVKKAVSKGASQLSRSLGGGGKKSGGIGGIFGLAAGMQQTLEEEQEREAQKKWWQFWKR